MELTLIRHGLRDEELKKEYSTAKRKGCLSMILGKILSLMVCLAVLVVFAFSMYMQVTESTLPNGIPAIRVVRSASMATRHEENTYLFEQGLENQIQTFDIIAIRHLPAEEELQLYDIVVYERDSVAVLHRIVGIEEPNEKHPGERHFLLQGDAVSKPDQFPVLYRQMQGIYRGERIPFVGSFVLFMQSPAGLLCIILVLFVLIAAPVVEKKLKKETEIRLKKLGE